MKVTAIPFILGSFAGGAICDNYGFAISATIVMGILVVTKQIKLL